MSNEFIAPIDHTATSAAASTAAGAAGGALKGGLKFGAGWIGGLTALGALIGVGIATGGFGFLATGPVIAGIVGGVLGLAAGVSSFGIPTAIGALFGGAKGAARASDEVKMERGAAAELQAKVDIIKAQSGPTTTVYAPSATNNNRGITAPSTVMAGDNNVQYDGKGVAGAELAAGAAR